MKVYVPIYHHVGTRFGGLQCVCARSHIGALVELSGWTLAKATERRKRFAKKRWGNREPRKG